MVPQSDIPAIPEGALVDSGTAPNECTLIYPYPGSMPAYLASRLIDRYSYVGQLVFDPFCGVGTVLLEATRLRRKAWGADLLATPVDVANVACNLPPAVEISEAWSRIRARGMDALFGRDTTQDRSMGPGMRMLRKWLEWYTFQEIVALRHAIMSEDDGTYRKLFQLLLGSALPSLSRREARGTLHWGWIADNVMPRPSELVRTEAFRELGARVDRLVAFVRATGAHRERSVGTVAFRRDWTVAGEKCARLPSNVDLLLTSPPYPYSIDYALSTRLSSYLLEDFSFNTRRRTEIGARYKRKRKDRSSEYLSELAGSIAPLASAVRYGGTVVLVLPDPKDYPSVLPFSHAQWLDFVIGMLGSDWRMREYGSRPYFGRRVMPTKGGGRSDFIVAAERRR